MNQKLSEDVAYLQQQWPLQSAQLGIFLADHLSEVNDLYSIAHCLELPKDLNLEQFKQAIQLGLNEADSVVADYSSDPAAPYLKLAHKHIEIECFDFRHLSQKQALERLWSWMPSDREAAKSLKDQGASLYRQVLFITHDKIFWYQRYHHIMLDGFSFIHLSKRIVQLYQDIHHNRAISASPFISLVEVHQEREAYLASAAFTQDREFWQGYCRELATPITLSTHHRTATTTAHFIQHQLKFSAGILSKIQALSAAHKLALPDMVMALSLHYLHKMTDKRDLVVGIPFMRRLGSKALRSTLPTVNVLPVQFHVEVEASWLSLAQHVKAEMQRVRRHQKYDAEQILRDLNAIDVHERLYGPILNYKAFDQALDIDGESIHTHHISTGPIDDFEFSFMLQNGELVIELRADAERYRLTELKAHAERLTLLLEQALYAPDAACQSFNLISPAEQRLLREWGTGPVFRHPAHYNNLLDIFYEQANLYPERIAIVSGERPHLKQLSFAQVKTQINQLTRFLKAKGAGRQTVVAGAIPRSSDSIILMLSVLNSGASFLPLDLDYPIERMHMMSEDAHPLFVVTTQALSQKLPNNMPQLYLDDAAVQAEIQAQSAEDITAQQRQFDFQDVAYVIFTSGSTGRPKGVMNTHGSLVNLILSHRPSIYLPALQAVNTRFPERTLRAAHTHSFSFDSSWLQVFWMIWGQELHIFDENMRRDAYALVQEIQARHIDTLDLPPSFCAQMMSNGLFEPGQHHPSLILIGGEAAPVALWQQLNAQPNLIAHNLYGPTEYTVDTFRAELKLTQRPVIANPIANTQAYVLDAYLQPCATGVIGELYIAGYGIANGYLGRADLSATRFVANPFMSGQRMYRTGDLVRWNHQGKLEFMGRCDDQIKIRGYRVEIGEVENALSLLEDVESVVVIAEPIHNSHRLLGYCVVKDRDLNEQLATALAAQYLAQLRQNLPDYMVPSALMVMAEFPRNVSGKVDKKALPKPQVSVQSRQAETAEQQLLCDISAKVLKLTRIGIDDDFFMVGGDSISAIMLCTQLREHGLILKPSDVFRLKTIAAMAKVVQKPTEAKPSIKAQVLDQATLNALQQRYSAQHFRFLPVLPLQKGMLFHAQSSLEADYQAFTRLSLDRHIDMPRLQLALNLVLHKHPHLAGCFDSQSSDEAVFVYPYQDLHDWPLQHLYVSEDQLEVHIEQALHTPMQVDQCYGLIRAVVLHTPSRAELVLIVHHLITDGWSTPLFMQDLLAAFTHLKPLPPLSHSYDSVIQALVQRDLQESRSIWQQDLHTCSTPLLFDQVNQAVQEQRICLNRSLTQALQQQLRQRGITLNVFMQMLWAMTLNSFNHQQDVVFGTPVAGRSAPIDGLDQQIGLFLNTIPVRVQLDPQADLWSQLDALQQLHMRHLEHDGLGLNAIQEICAQGPLFDTLLVVENYPDHQYLQQALGDAHITNLTNRGYSHYPLALLVIPDQEIELLLEQRGVLQAPEALLQRLVSWIEIALTQPEQAISAYPLLDTQAAALIQQVNQTAYPVPQITLQALLREQALQTPDQIALEDAMHCLSFAQVRAQVEHLAAQLQSHGVGPGEIVAVALPRSVHLSIAILAVIEAGAAYIPIDVQHPLQRIEFMLQDAKPKVLIQADTRFNAIAAMPSVIFDQLAAIESQTQSLNPTQISPAHPAYLIYTSGTTGRPKGVLVSHQAIVNRILWMQHQYPLDQHDCILQKTPCSFDVSVWEFFWSYLVGARLYMAAPDAHRDPLALIECIQQHNITTLHFVPSMLSVFESAVQQALHPTQIQALPLKQVFCSGEALSSHLASAFRRHFSAQLHNLYGPTEAAVDVSYFPAAQDQGTNSSVAIGYPVWNTELYILDAHLRSVGFDQQGELYLAGDQLALGYLGRSDLTATRFVANPFKAGQRMYRTGDMARWNSDGSVQYLGRSDDQLKIRGQRIELGEIEQLLQSLVPRSEVVVHAMPVGETTELSLVAYLKTALEVDIDRLKHALSQQLPAYMLPQHWVRVDEFPVSHNGKLDRKALPQPQQHVQVMRYAETAQEQQLESIFQKLLNTQQRIGVEQDFFSLGGHSILAMKLAIEIRKRFDQNIAMQQLMSHVSIARLVHLLNHQDTSANASTDPVFTIREGSQRPIFCFYPGSGSAWQYTALSPYIDAEIGLIGLQSPRPDGLLARSESMQQLVSAQLEQIQALQPHGPYSLLGYSLGGTVAYSVAAALQAQGEQVDYLGLLDTYPAEIHQWQEESIEEKNAEAEQLQFFADLMLDADPELYAEATRMQEDIFANYRDAVRLLKPYQMPHFKGHLYLSVAERGLLNYIQPEQVWTPLVDRLTITSLAEASHSTILSPAQLKTLGPILNAQIVAARREAKA